MSDSKLTAKQKNPH